MKNVKIIDYEKTGLREILIQSGIFGGFVFLFWFLFMYRRINDFNSFINLFLYANTYTVILLFNIHYLFKKLFLKRKYFSYSIITITTFLAGYLIQQYIFSDSVNELIEKIKNEYQLYLLDWSINILTFTLFGGVGLAFKLILLWSRTKSELIELQKINLEIELQNLKNQISPHFLFNTLNNLYILTKTRPTAAAEAILCLSDLIRRQYKSISEDMITIGDEIEYIMNLLKLEEIRRDHLEISLDINIDDDSFKLNPMILSPLVENAVKHGSQKLNHCVIEISVKTTKERMFFRISNSIPEHETQTFAKGSGLSNLERRLELCYSDNYYFQAKVLKDRFEAILELGAL